ncbi:hypothetical protein BsWGS_24985 [Bradybaena similaris]
MWLLEGGAAADQRRGGHRTLKTPEAWGHRTLKTPETWGRETGNQSRVFRAGCEESVICQGIGYMKKAKGDSDICSNNAYETKVFTVINYNASCINLHKLT